ncbi:hypothetical protein [Halomarina rubra]|uniref:Uncharacterized protein n=1 Tax=Halomarina rubra TaxID=2071873 RepID=A0ABD6AWI7_9EURY|nr:hypothetical protein [Halomarina rubra]
MSKSAQLPRRIYSVVLIVVLVLLVTHHTIAFYPAIEEKRTHRQLTEANYEGGTWFIEHSNIKIETHTFQAGLFRIADLSEAKKGKLTDSRYRWTPTVKSGFAYGPRFSDRVYVVATTTGIEYYPRAFPQFPDNWRYTPENFENFYRAQDAIYSSGSFHVSISNSS